MYDDGRVFAFGECCLCEREFAFDVNTVPSLWLDPETELPPDIGNTAPEYARRQPVCPDCVQRFNDRRAKLGLPLAWP